MSQELIPHQPADLAVALDRAAAYAAQGVAPNTRRALAAGWAAFSTWCKQQGLASLPAEPATVAAYLAALADAGLSVATMGVFAYPPKKVHYTHSGDSAG